VEWQGIAVSKDVLMLGIGLSLLVDDMTGSTEQRGCERA
jgi:hypothetical protein